MQKISSLLNNDTIHSLSEKTHNVYESKVKPVVSTVSQFLLWYIMYHTIYWSIEQLRFSWCVPCGIAGYVQSLIVSQSLLCRLLTNISQAMADQQLNTITMLSSFIGIKYLSMSNPKKESTKNTQNTQNTQNAKTD